MSFAAIFTFFRSNLSREEERRSCERTMKGPMFGFHAKGFENQYLCLKAIRSLLVLFIPCLDQEMPCLPPRPADLGEVSMP